MKKTPTHLVVDGSNIATEGRSMPSLTQLEEAVDAFVAEENFDNVIVIVDATFGHRIGPKERKWFDELVATNRVITPPAGAIGRGDAFILQVATRAHASVLSNDSFQEFHGEHTWLFDEGRLFGGKPVPHVGWVFVSRTPVRGPTSRRAVKEAKSTDKPPAKRTRSALASVGASNDSATQVAMPASDTKEKATKSRSRRGAKSTQRTTAATPEPTPTDKSKSTTDGTSNAKRRSRRGRKSKSDGTRSDDTVFDRKFNETVDFQRFRDDHPVDDVVEVAIDRFSSHGAYATIEGVEVYVPTRSLGDPPPSKARDVLTLGESVLMAVARYDDESCGVDVRAIRKDEHDAYYASPRASASTTSSNPEADDSVLAGSEQPTRRGEPVAIKKAAKKATVRKTAAKKAPAKKTAAKRAPARKAPAKKAAVKKAPAKKAVAKKAPAKKAAVKKAPAKKTAAKRAPAKKAAVKKTAAKKTAAKRAPAKKAAAKKTVAKRAPAKKAAAKKSVRRTTKR